MSELNLNDVQKQAVEAIDKPTLIFAGAGTGKTRVLTHKIAYLIIEKGYNPDDILAVTFTNKAAAEMRTRVQSLLGKKSMSLNIGTFHSICARLLRHEIVSLGFTPDFAIYDTADQDQLIKTLMLNLKLTTNGISAAAYRSRMSFIKSSMEDPSQLMKNGASPFD